MSPPFSADNHFPVSLDTIQSKEVPCFDFYLSRDGESKPLLYRSRSIPLTARDLQELHENNIQTLWIRTEDRPSYEEYLNNCLISRIKDPSVSLDKRCELSYNMSSQLMQEVFNSNDSSQVIQASQQALDSMVEVIFADANAAHRFLVTAGTDYRIYTHSINVCLFGIGMAKQSLGLSKQDALSRFGPGFLLHDIGKLSIAREILEKPGPLTEQEWEEIYKHPQVGLEQVKQIVDISADTESIILHHHERLDGSGYPFGLQGSQIGIGARICALADTFDALSTNRPFQRRMDSFSSLMEIKKAEVPRRLDENLFRDFVYLFMPVNQR